MFKPDFFLRFTRINEYLHVLVFIFPLIFIIYPSGILSYKTIAIFFANLFLTAFVYMFNDLEDAEDDYHDLNKRKRNPIASGEIEKIPSYFLNFFLLFIGLSLLTFINYSVFILGIILAIVGFFYSWKPLRLKSKPIVDLISHVISLGVLQFFITYLAFRSLDLFVIPFLMVIIPFSVINEILHEYQDFEIDKKTNINNSVQKFDKSNIKKLLTVLTAIIIIGLSIIIYNIPMKHPIINFAFIAFTGMIVIYRVYTRSLIIR